MDEQDQLEYPQGLFADSPFSFDLDPLGSAEQYLSGDDPFDIRPYEIVKQAVSGYLSGFSTLPIGEVPTNRIEQFARQGGHMAGFLGLLMPKKMIQSAGRRALAKHGMSSAAAAVANFRSIPMFAADVATRHMAKSKAGASALGYLDRTGRLSSRQFIEEGVHLGIASSVSAWSDGFQAMAVAGLQGGLLGAGSASLANIPFLKSRDTTTNILRGITTGIMDAAPTYYMGGDALDIAYSAVLGTYFGYRQPNAEMARAQQFYYRENSEAERGNKGNLYKKGGAFFKLPESVQEEVKKLVDLDKEREVGTVLNEWNDFVNQALAGDTSAPKSRVKTESDKIWDFIKIREQYNTGLLPQRRVVDFAENLIKEGTNPDLHSWNSREVARLVETVGQEARVNQKMSWESFQKNVTGLVKKATGEDVSPELVSTLREYHLDRTQTREVPTFGYSELHSGLVSFNEGSRNFNGDLINTHETVNQLNLLQRENGMLDGRPDMAGHFVVQGYQDLKGQIKETYDLDPTTFMYLGNVVDPATNPTMRVANLDGTKVDVPLFDGSGLPRFYFAHGENNKARFHGVLYNTGQGIDVELPRIFKALSRVVVGKEKGKDIYYDPKKDYDELRFRFVNQANSELSRDGAEVEYARQFVSNVRYWEQMNRGVSLETLVTKDGFLSDVSGFNKRLQPLFNNFYRVGSEVLDRKARYLVVNDLSEFAFTTDGTTKTKIGSEVTDGSVFLSDDLFDRLIKFTNLKNKDGSSLKPFILSDDKKNGLLIGKMAFHRADGATGEAMAKAGLDMLIHNSSAKQKGLRTSHSYRVDDGVLKITGKDGKFRDVADDDGYGMDVSDIMLNLDKGDSDSGSIRIAKQLATALAKEQMQFHFGGKRYGDRAIANERERHLYSDIMQRGLLGDGKTKALDTYLSSRSEETLNAIFDGDRNAPVHKEDKIALFNRAFTKGNEALRDRLTRWLHDEESKGNLTDDDDVSLSDADSNTRAEMLDRQLNDSKGPADNIFALLSQGEHSAQAVSFSSHMKRKVASLYGNWIISSMTRPIHESGFKAIFKGISPGLARNITYDGKDIRFGDDDPFVHTATRDVAEPIQNKGSYKGGYENKGKGTPIGDGKDQYMRSISLHAITELASDKPSSTSTTRSLVPDLSALVESGQKEAKSAVEAVNSGDTIMLARNGSLTGKPLSKVTTDLLDAAIEKGAKFVVGDMPGVDEPFVRYLESKGAEFTMHGSGKEKGRFTLSTPAPESSRPAMRPDLTDKTYLLEDGLKTELITATTLFKNRRGLDQFGSKKRTIEDVFNDMQSTDNAAYRERLSKDLNAITVRVPMGDISGAQDITLGGFTGTKGRGVILHEKTMKRLGGADLDIDDGFMYFNMPQFMRDIVKVNRDNPDRFAAVEKDAVAIFLRRPDLAGFARDASRGTKMLSMFDPEHRIVIGQEVSKGQNTLTPLAVGNRLILNTMYSHAMSNGGSFDDPLPNGYRLRYVARNDNGELLRARSNGAVTAAVDVSKFGAVARPEEMLAIMFDGAFSRIEIINPLGKTARVLMHENSMVYKDRGEIHFDDDNGVFARFTTGKAKSVRVHDMKKFRKGITTDKDALTSFGLAETMFGKLRDVNRHFFGTDKFTNRPYELQDKIQSAKSFPRDADGQAPRGYLRELSLKMQTLKPDNMAILDYVYDDFSRFESSYKEVANYVNQNDGGQLRSDLPFFFADGHRVSIPSKKLFNLLRSIRSVYAKTDGSGEDNRFRLDTSEGRENIARDKKSYENIFELARSSDHKLGDTLNEWKKSRFWDRVRALGEVNSEVNRFVEHDIDEMAAIPVVRQFYVASTLTPSEAKELVDLSTYMKGAFATAHKQSIGQLNIDKSEIGVARDSKSAQRLAKDTFRSLYEQFFSGQQQGLHHDNTGPNVLREGVDLFLERVNSSPSRRGSGEAQVTIDGVRNFFDSLLISAHGSETVLDKMRQKAIEDNVEFSEPDANRSLNVLRTQTKSIGFEVASPEVIKEWTEQYDRLFGNVVSGRHKDNTKALMQGSMVRKEAEGRVTGLETVHEIIYPDKVELSDEVKAVRDSLFENLRTYKAFREDPNSVLYVMRYLYGKAQPGDFTFDDLKGFDSLVKGWKHGNTFTSWMLRGGFKTLAGAKKLAESEGKEFKLWHTLQFMRTNSDFTKTDDIRLLDKWKNEGITRLRTNTQNADGTWETKYISAPTRVPESWFDRLIDLNGVTRDTLTNSAHEKMSREVTDAMAPFMKAGFISSDTGKNHQDEIFDFAVREMELAGVFRTLDRDDLTPKEVEKYSTFVQHFMDRKDRSVQTLAEIHDIDMSSMTRDDAEMAISDKLYTVNREGAQYDMTLRAISNELGGRLQTVLTKIYNDHIHGEAWIEKYLLPYVGKDGEINMVKWSESLSTMFQLSLPKSPDQHIPHDPGKLFAQENEILIEAMRSLSNKEIIIPNNAESIRNLSIAHKNTRSLVRTLFGPDVKARVENLEEAKTLADTIRKGLDRTNDLAPEEVDGLYLLADYLHKDLDSRDMRRLWTKQTYYSQFEQDILATQGRGSANALSYARKKLRNRYVLKSTEFVDGMFPHLNHDKKILEADALVRSLVHNDVETTKSFRDEINKIMMRKTEDSSSDAYADLMLDDNSGSFLSRFAPETFGSALDRDRNWDGYEVTPSVLNTYVRKLAGSSYNNVAHTLSRNAIRAFERGGAMGDHNGTWANWMRLYVRDTMGKPTVFTKEMLNDEGMKLKSTPYYLLSDHLAITKMTSANRFLVRVNDLHREGVMDKEVFRLENGRERTLAEVKAFESDMLDSITSVGPNDTLRDDQVKLLGGLYKGVSDLEAKYEMMALLFHAKSYVANKIGGTTNLVAETGWKSFRQSAKLEYWQGVNPEFKSMADVNNWVAGMGVIENYITHEAGITGRFREGKWAQFFNDVTDALAKDPLMKDESLYAIAKRNGITERSVDIGASFMRSSERDLRTRSFLAGYVKARESFGPMDGMRFDEPFLLNQARKTVATSQFLYGASERPPFSRTSIGKMHSRFKLWGWSSPRMRRIIYQDARDHGFAIGSREFDRLKRIAMADLMAMSLAAMFPFSLFEFTLPPPFSWISDVADYFFGDGYEQESAFFGSPLGPLNELTPVFASKFVNLTDTVIRGFVSGEIDTMANYQLATLFPFGRMGYDVNRALNDPANAHRYLAGVPLREFAGLRDKIERGKSVVQTAPVLEEAFANYSGGATEREVVGFFTSQGLEDTDARVALKEALDQGIVSRSLEKTSTGRAYVYQMHGDADDIVRQNTYGSSSLTRGF